MFNEFDLIDKKIKIVCDFSWKWHAISDSFIYCLLSIYNQLRDIEILIKNQIQMKTLSEIWKSKDFVYMRFSIDISNAFLISFFY